MLKGALLLILTSTFLLAGNLLAAPTIYVVDMQKVVDSSIIGKALRSDLEADAKKAEAKLAVGRQELERNKSEIDKQVSLLSESALNEKREGLIKKQRELDRLRNDLEEDLRRKSQTGLSKVIEQAQRVITNLATDKSYPLIVEKGTKLVVYSDPKYDLSDQIIKILNQEKTKL